jgi:hypothetical protein
MKKIAIALLVLILLLSILCLKISLTEYFTNNQTNSIISKTLKQINQMCGEDFKANDITNPDAVTKFSKCMDNPNLKKIFNTKTIGDILKQ